MAGHEVQYGKHRTRRSFSRIKEVLDLPNLIEIQTDSFQDFLDYGLKEVFEDVLPVSNFTDTMELEFVGYELKEPKYTLEEARAHDANYSAPIYVTFRLVNKETGEIKTQEVFFGEFPIMTEMGTFIINGAERIIVSQLVRSPGVYFNDKVDKNGKVTGVKAGKTTVYAVTEDGENLTCKVTVKENKFSSVKLSSSDVDYNKCVMEVYKASFDKSGNLVMTARIVNNTTDYITALKDVNIVVKDASGKTIGTYKTSRYNVTVSSYSTKDVKFTLKKSSLKKKKFDLRNATITRKGGAYYYR